MLPEKDVSQPAMFEAVRAVAPEANFTFTITSKGTIYKVLFHPPSFLNIHMI